MAYFSLGFALRISHRGLLPYKHDLKDNDVNYFSPNTFSRRYSLRSLSLPRCTEFNRHALNVVRLCIHALVLLLQPAIQLLVSQTFVTSFELIYVHVCQCLYPFACILTTNNSNNNNNNNYFNNNRNPFCFDDGMTPARVRVRGPDTSKSPGYCFERNPLSSIPFDSFRFLRNITRFVRSSTHAVSFTRERR